MQEKSITFIGGGRIVKILLQGLQKANKSPQQINVCETSSGTLQNLQKRFQDIKINSTTLTDCDKFDYIFLAVHPPVMGEVLGNMAGHVKENSIVISLAPKFICARISELLNGHKKIVRMIPNAPSIVNAGYNPVYFNSGISDPEKQELLEFFATFGQTPEVEENQLEAYAMITGMGPTYLWFQWQELEKLSVDFGMTPDQAKTAMYNMLSGAIKALHRSGLTYEEVIDLIPVKPIGEHEEQISEIYRTKLTGLFNKIKS